MKYVQWDSYYHDDTLGLVRTVCRVTDIKTNISSIAFVKVGEGGCASEIFSMEEEEFKKIFLGL